MNRTLKRQAVSDASSGWGSEWVTPEVSPADLENLDHLDPPKTPEDQEENAQPRAWHDWVEPYSQPYIPASQPRSWDAAEWHHDSWHADPASSKNHDWHSGNSDTWYAGTSWSDPTEFMKKTEADLRKQIGDDFDAEPDMDGTKARMGKRDLKNCESIEEALALLHKDRLPANHRVLQGGRRSGKFAQAEKQPDESPKDYMQRFLETELQAITKRHTHTEYVIEEDSTVGTFMSFDKIVEAEGGYWNPENVKAAERRCLKCIKKGRKYFKWDTWGERVNYAMVVESFSSATGNKWDITSSGTQAAEADKPAPPTPVPKGTVPRTLTSCEKAMRDATTTKSLYEKAESKATTLLTSMGAEPEFAKEGESKLELEKLVANGAALKAENVFFQAFMVKEPADIKAAYPNEAALEIQLNDFVKQFNEAAVALQGKRTEILNVVKIRNQAAMAKKTKPAAKAKAKPKAK